MARSPWEDDRWSPREWGANSTGGGGGGGAGGGGGRGNRGKRVKGAKGKRKRNGISNGAAVLLFAKTQYTGANYNPTATNPETQNTVLFGSGAIVTDNANEITVQETRDYMAIQRQRGYDRNYFDAQIHVADSTISTYRDHGEANSRGSVDDFTRGGFGAISGTFQATDRVRLQNYNNRTEAFSNGSSMSLISPGTLVAHMRHTTSVGSYGPSVIMPMDATEYGDANNVVLGSNYMVVPNDGWYLVHARISLASQTTTKERLRVSSDVDGDIIYGGVYSSDNTTGRSQLQSIAVRYLLKDTQLSLYTDFEAAYTTYSDANKPNGTSLTLWQLNPKDVIGVWSGLTGTMAIGTGTTLMTDHDTNLKGNGSVMSSAGVFTVPQSGWYLGVHETIVLPTSVSRIHSGSLESNYSASTTGQFAEACVEEEGTNASDEYTVLNGCDLVELVAGETVTLRTIAELKSYTKVALPQNAALIKVTTA